MMFDSRRRDARTLWYAIPLDLRSRLNTAGEPLGTRAREQP